MKTQHTPGPWYAVEVHVQSARLNEDNYVCEAEGNNRAQAEANARLIAAAPELAEALRECITEDGALAWRNAEFAGRRLEAISNIARSALARIEGRER